MSLFQYRLPEVHNMLNTKAVSVSELTEDSLSVIAERDSKVHAFLTLNEEGARAKARELDDKLASGASRGLLFGLPAGIKDNIVTEGLRTTCASQFLTNFKPIYDATVVSKLREADAVTIGKLNMDEFAMGGSNENSSFNPIAIRGIWNMFPAARAVVRQRRLRPEKCFSPSAPIPAARFASRPPIAASSA